MADQPRFLRLPQVLARTGLSRSSMYDRLKSGSFPAGYKLGPGARSVGFLESDITAWIEAQVQRSRPRS